MYAFASPLPLNLFSQWSSHHLGKTCVSKTPKAPAVVPSFPKPVNMSLPSKDEDDIWDVVIVGSGFGGLCCAAVTTALGLETLVLESHYAPGGVAHGFEVKNAAGTFKFDTGPSFYCGLEDSGGERSVNPVKLALDAVGESVSCVPYGKTGYVIDDLRRGTTIRVCEDEEATLASIEQAAGRDGVAQLKRFNSAMRSIHENMRIPAIALRPDWKVMPVVFRRWAMDMLGLLPHVGDVKRPVSDIMKRIGVTNPEIVRYLDTEAFLLSGLKTTGTITAEIAFMVGERDKRDAVQYPIGGSRAIIDALVRGIEKSRGRLELNSHVERIEVVNGRAEGVVVKGRGKKPDRKIRARKGWDTFAKDDALVGPEHLPSAFVEAERATPAVESFMHVHMAFPTAGLPPFDGHHAVTIDSGIEIDVPGNTVMISSPTVWSPDLAPEGFGIIHAYTLEPYERWPELVRDKKAYTEAKKLASEPLFTAIRSVIPDIDSRLEHPNAICMLGSPVTHARFCRRWKGTYGPAIAAGTAEFPWPRTPVENLFRIGDSVFPGIGVPAAAASGLIAAAGLVGIGKHAELVDAVYPPEAPRRK